MRDEFFEIFVEEFGEATLRVDVPEATIDAWRGKLPDQLLHYWRSEGWCGYSNGLIWTVDPTDYEAIVQDWIRGTPLAKIDTFHVIARTAFGALYLWGERSADSVTILPYQNAILCLPSDLKRVVRDPNLAAGGFFSCWYRSEADTDDAKGKPLFDRALKKLGALNIDEMYGFESPLILGGAMDLKNLSKVNIFDHLGMLRQLAPPTFPMANISLDDFD